MSYDLDTYTAILISNPCSKCPAAQRVDRGCVYRHEDLKEMGYDPSTRTQIMRDGSERVVETTCPVLVYGDESFRNQYNVAFETAFLLKDGFLTLDDLSYEWFDLSQKVKASYNKVNLQIEERERKKAEMKSRRR